MHSTNATSASFPSLHTVPSSRRINCWRLNEFVARREFVDHFGYTFVLTNSDRDFTSPGGTKCYA